MAARTAIALLVRPSSRSTAFVQLHTPITIIPYPAVHHIRLYATHRSGSAHNAHSGPSAPGSSSPTPESTADVLRRLEAASRRQGGTSGGFGQPEQGGLLFGVGASGRNKTWKKWNQLGLGGKLVRSFRQAGNLTIILFGGGLIAFITLLLTTELFATNSPNVLYSQAVDVIRASHALDAHLLPPLTFTLFPTSSGRSSGSVAHAFKRNPITGRDHMLITFWVHGRGSDEPETLGWLKSAWGTVKDNVMDVAKSAGIIGPEEFEQGKGEKAVSQVNEDVPQAQVVTSGGGWFSGLLGSLSLKGGPSAAGQKWVMQPAGTYKLGMVKGDYVKDANGQYQLLQLSVNMQDAPPSYPEIVIYKAPGAETEALERLR